MRHKIFRSRLQKLSKALAAWKYFEGNFFPLARQYRARNFIHKILGESINQKNVLSFAAKFCMVFILKAFHTADNGTWNYVSNRLEKPCLMKKSIPPQRHVASFSKCQFFFLRITIHEMPRNLCFIVRKANDSTPLKERKQFTGGWNVPSHLLHIIMKGKARKLSKRRWKFMIVFWCAQDEKFGKCSFRE